MKPRHATALALAMILTGRTTTGADMSAWVGKPESELLSSWGAPDSSAPLVEGGKVDTWVTNWNSGYNLRTCRKSFTIDNQGNIARYSFSDCKRFQ